MENGPHSARARASKASCPCKIQRTRLLRLHLSRESNQTASKAISLPQVLPATDGTALVASVGVDSGDPELCPVSWVEGPEWTNGKPTAPVLHGSHASRGNCGPIEGAPHSAHDATPRGLTVSARQSTGDSVQPRDSPIDGIPARRNVGKRRVQRTLAGGEGLKRAQARLSCHPKTQALRKTTQQTLGKAEPGNEVG